MQKLKICVIEDEIEILNYLTTLLVKHQFECITFKDGMEAYNFLKSNPNCSIDLLILDRMLPGLSGLDLLKHLRENEKNLELPILMLTALSRPEQIIEGLDLGADDYITKPFDPNILLARIHSLLRRREQLLKKEIIQNIYLFKNIKLNLDQCKAWIDEEQIELTLSEFKILTAFIKSPGKVLTRNQLVQSIQDTPVFVTERTIDTHIFGLRKKLQNHAAFIETIRGVGYRINPED